MSRASTKQASQTFFSDPTVARFKTLQHLAFDSEDYDPVAAQLLAIEADLNAANPARLLKEVEQLSPIYQVCPRFHYIDARIRESLGEIGNMQQSIARLRDCLTAITETGDGTSNSPFLVTFITDEDDVVRSFGEQTRYQQPLTGNLRQFDVITAKSGLEFWFDVTRIAERRQELQATELTEKIS